MNVAELKQKYPGMQCYHMRMPMMDDFRFRFTKLSDHQDVSDKSVYILGPPITGWPTTEFNNKIVILDMI